MERLMDSSIIRALREQLTIPVWSTDQEQPSAARALNLKSKDTAYRAAREGSIPVVRIGRSMRVPCAALRKMLAIDEAA
jgi:excisionase family DNA binding protein